MDFDDDGVLDFISGSYDPGDVYLFRGLGKGKYAAVETLLDRANVPLVHHPEELIKYERLKKDANADEDERIQARVASFGSWPAMVDWDADGDLDLLIGSFSGDLFLRLNEGSRKQPVFSEKSVPVNAAGKPLHVNGHADPVPVDWDGDGLWDLVVGASDGSVGWYRNTGSATKPVLGERKALVDPPSHWKFWTQYLEPGQAPRPGVRAQICVTDHDGDGRPDLLVGDYSQISRLRSLDAKERAELEQLLRSEAELYKQTVGLAYDSAESRALRAKLESIDEKRKAYLDPAAERRTSSFIWLFRRKPAR